MFCPYCNPCDPFQLIPIYTNSYNLLPNLLQNAHVIQTTFPSSIDIVLYNYPNNYGIIKHRSTKKALLEFLHGIDKNRLDFLPFSIDIHAITQILPENTTLNFYNNHDPLWLKWKIIKVPYCPKTNNQVYHPAALRVLIHRVTRTHLTSLQQIGLVFQRQQLRFVSCHKQQSIWIHQLQELFLAFDYQTWILIAISCTLVAFISVLQTDKLKTTSLDTFLYNCFTLSSSLLDQSSDLFQWPRKRPLFLFCLPFMFLIICEEREH